jgi:nitrous oxide reductase accessory protein NosL
MGGMNAPLATAKPADPEPHVNDIAKYPKCNYCGMDRKKFHFSRMLIDYVKDLPDPLCSIRCAASSLITKLGRGPKAIWASDNASPAEEKPLILVDKATFLVGSKLPTVMTRRSKAAFSTLDAAEAAQTVNGGELMDFDGALFATYTEVAENIKSNRATIVERLKRAQQQQQSEQRQNP